MYPTATQSWILVETQQFVVGQIIKILPLTTTTHGHEDLAAAYRSAQRALTHLESFRKKAFGKLP